MSVAKPRIEYMYDIDVYGSRVVDFAQASGGAVVRMSVPVALEAVAAGWPSAAQDYYSGEIDLNVHLIANKAATFIVRVAGDSMLEAGISDGDELIVDRSIKPASGQIVIAVLDGELTVKRLEVVTAGVFLRAANPKYPDIRVAELADLQIWGVVTRCLHYV